MKPIVYKGLGGYFYFGCNLKRYIIMKTFKDFLDKETSFDLPPDVVQAIIRAENRFHEYQENYKRQEELKKEVIKRIEENEILEITCDPNYNVYKANYNESFHPPKEYKSGMSLLTIVFKNTKQC